MLKYITQMFLITLIVSLHSILTFAHSSPESQLLTNRNCQFVLSGGDSQEDIYTIIELAYEESVEEVVISLGLSYQIVLSYIYQYEKELAQERGQKIGGPGSATLSQTYKDGAIALAIQLGVRATVNQIDMTHATLVNSINRQYRTLSNARQVAEENKGKTYSKELKQRAVELARKEGIYATANQLNIPFGYVYSWYHKYYGFGR